MAFGFIPLVNKKFADINPKIFGSMKCKKDQNFGGVIRKYCLIHYVRSGCGTFESPMGTFKVKKNQIFVIRAGEWNNFYSDSKDPWSYIWVGFDGNMQKYFENSDKVVFDYDGNLFTEMQFIERNKSMREEFLASKLMMLIFELFKSKEEETYDLARILIDHIDINYKKTNLTVNQIANSLGYNRNYLAKVFKKTQGMTIQEYIIQKRINRAKTLLKAGHRVNFVAQNCGYNDTANFSKMFKKIVGVSPAYYKETEE